MSFDRSESGKWAQATHKQVGELFDGVTKALAEDASRGFPLPTGDTLWGILKAGQQTKAALVEANSKIYDERRDQLFSIDDFTLKVLVRLSRLAMELYREQIFNALSLEQSQAAATTERNQADVERLNFETQQRQVAIIQAKAEIEESINIYKQQLISAQYETMKAQKVLIQAQLETAEKKLEIINSIYKVLAAEQLVLAAENRRAASLQTVLAAEQIVAQVKQEMVPYYQAKADAEKQLAAAITAEIPVLEAIERLGYDRVALKKAQDDAEHQITEAEEDRDLAQEAKIRAEAALHLAREQSGLTLEEYANTIRTEILAVKKELGELGIDFKLSTSLAREAIGLNDNIAVMDHERSNLTIELVNLLNNLQNTTEDQKNTVEDSAVQLHSETTDAFFSRKITKGFIAGTSPAGALVPKP
jgi:hypothetical protein